MALREAQKFLSNKKVFVKNKGKEVQEKLFNVGFKWLKPNKIYKDRYFLFLYEDLTLTYTNEIDFFYNHEFEEISAEDILNIKVGRLPKTWKEFCENNPVKEGEAHILFDSSIHAIQLVHPRRHKSDKSILPSYKAAKAYLALMQLHQLRNYYRQEFSKFPYAISRNGNRLYISNNEDKFLSFQTKEIANEFLNNFRGLIEQAGDLI